MPTTIMMMMAMMMMQGNFIRSLGAALFERMNLVESKG